MAQQRQQAGADQVCGGLLRANHGEYEIRDDLVFVEMVAVDVRVRERSDQAATMPHRRLAYRGEEVRTHRVETLSDVEDAAGVLLEVAQHPTKLLGPHLQHPMVIGRHAEDRGGDQRGQRIRDVRHDVHFAACQGCVNEPVHNLLRV